MSWVRGGGEEGGGWGAGRGQGGVGGGGGRDGKSKRSIAPRSRKVERLWHRWRKTVINSLSLLFVDCTPHLISGQYNSKGCAVIQTA